MSDPEAAPAWEIEELTDVRERITTSRPDRWVGALIAVAVGIVGFGFIGHWSAADPVPGHAAPPRDLVVAEPHRSHAVSPLVLNTPADGAGIDGGLVEVRGFALRPLGSVHLAVLLGDAVLGWSNLDIKASGPIATTIRVFAPTFDVPVVLDISGAALHNPTDGDLSIHLQLHAAERVNLWRTQLAGSARSRTVLVEGFGVVGTSVVDIDVTTASGLLVATGSASIGEEAGRSGGAGGWMIGLGSFTLRLPLDRPTTEPLRVTLHWHDRAARHTTSQLISRAAAPGARSASSAR